MDFRLGLGFLRHIDGVEVFLGLGPGGFLRFLEIGYGIGRTYSLHGHRNFLSLTCIDSSQRQLEPFSRVIVPQAPSVKIFFNASASGDAPFSYDNDLHLHSIGVHDRNGGFFSRIA
jgi:hypothetical protein